MRGHNAVLHIGPGPHFLGATDEHPHLPPAHLGKQLRLLRLGVGVVNERDLLLGNSLGDELRFYIVVDVEFAVALGGAQIAEHQLGPPDIRAVPPFLDDVLHTGIDLAVGVVGQQGILQPLVQRQLAAIRGNFQHIVLVRLHFSVPHSLRPVAQLLHHLLLEGAGFGGDGDILRFRRGQVQHIRRLNVSGLLPDADELRQVVELGEPGLGPEPRPLWLQLHSRHLLAEIRRPVVEMAVAVLHQRVELEVAHHRIQFYHRIADGRARGEGDAPPAGELVHVAALAKHIAGFLGVGLGDARHTAHFCVEEQILKAVCLVHKQPVNAQFLKGHHIVLFLALRQPLQLGLQIFLGFFQLLDGKTILFLLLGFPDGLYDLVDLVLNDGLLTLRGEGNLLKLAVPDDNSVIVAGGDPGAELPAAFGLKVLFGGYQHLRAGIKAQKIAAPLLRQVVGDDE